MLALSVRTLDEAKGWMRLEVEEREGERGGREGEKERERETGRERERGREGSGTLCHPGMQATRLIYCSPAVSNS